MWFLLSSSCFYFALLDMMNFSFDMFISFVNSLKGVLALFYTAKQKVAF